MIPTVDSFHALARSSPWRWRTLHFTHRGPLGVAEAWVRRPGRMLVRSEGREHRVDEGLEAPAITMTFHGPGPHVEPEMPDPMWPHDVSPLLRTDGLVAERPDGWWIQYDDPMWQTYSWVAMLDPVELSHHVSVADLSVDDVFGRETWRAVLRAEEGYAPRCGGNCCELLFSDVARRAEFEDPTEAPPLRPGVVYPDAYDVALDVQTGVVVRCLPVGGSDDSPWLEVDIHEVDADLDYLFPPG